LKKNRPCQRNELKSSSSTDNPVKRKKGEKKEQIMVIKRTCTGRGSAEAFHRLERGGDNFVRPPVPRYCEEEKKRV